MELADIAIKFGLIIIIFLISLVVAMYSTYAERKIAAFFQDRIGPNRAGPFGILQPLADGAKMFMKEEIIPTNATPFLFIVGPSLAILTACIGSAVIPWGQDLVIGGKVIPLQVTDINVGILYIFGVVSLGVYGVMIGGWASNNKYSLLGAIRAASQNISYEISMGLSIIALLLVTGTLSLGEIAQQQHGWHWNVIYQPVGFILFLVCAFAETNRTPFDLPECETELVGGYHTEYSSMKLGFYLFAEYINMFISSAVMATLYWGGYNYPGMDWVTAHVGPVIGPLIGTAVFFAKIFAFIFFFMWVRWTIPRFRYDQLMDLGWKILIPLAIANIVVTGIVITLFN
ncbi:MULTISPECIES: NADH-quinone oxidoreductase subunit NuoH [unclassified Mucilaginibacter]|uniref:NADH-quinone oxidoreductase subunit NuoH n=1 Tax=unclassified Mucilaginibacter TaxID=2617802 RepID=UPI002AC8AA37|nr:MULTISPECIES: NADH-quinone oxidoreductase subunit NuoH [unclassified Mucilaginibacter]MEB0248682.1 NADH-quinone oxidoreductase subunit NuoH [Mucilaginibacter sp. 5B2]MEB0262157.1 NADH-quinone oxidoreductase subunit NuoH [Mucilaginibacter sp. 10I4]MEB0279818.1 NADH-quinone oxidoreductase subunit NuoH [Mucilaginibacter sp. 10B2]MEB0301230.1 NADH-quinone oxidoreductase subunit NuoH [Mucilaginibacter sp. 5C4]WPX24210.1 NADH-quinone oxidoreductase subunit NuoH [Mucilaginibacter sp. 5C4]